MFKKKYIIQVLVAAVILTSIYCGWQYANHTPIYNEAHIHADVLVRVSGLNVLRHSNNTPDYQSTAKIARHQFLHLHDEDFEVLHIHAKRQTFAKFLDSLGIHLDMDCINVRDGVSACREDGLKLFVNEKEYKKNFDRYVPKDLDKILLTNASQEDVPDLSSQIQEKACIQSRKCPKPEGVSTVESCSSDTGCPVPPSIEPLAY